MRKIFSLAASAAIVAALTVPVFAQEGGQPREGMGGEGAFYNFLAEHPQMKAELEADPDRINNPNYAKNHPELQEFYERHPEVRTEMQENARDFMRHEKDQMAYHKGFDNFHDYLKGHPDVEDQLEKNPNLADDQNFLKQHPNLHGYLKSHPEVAWQMKHDPHQFFSKEDRSLDHPNASSASNGAAMAPAASAPEGKPHKHKHQQSGQD